MMGWRLMILAMVLASPAAADTVGPPAPPKVKATAAQQAMADYKSNFGAVPRPVPCQRPKDNETVVCGTPGRGGSPERLPLPEERGPPIRRGWRWVRFAPMFRRRPAWAPVPRVTSCTVAAAST